MTLPLIDLCQCHLITALQARIRATEQAVGQRFGFEVVQHDNATAFFAHRWPRTAHTLPFHRIFHYRAPGPKDPLLDRLVDEGIDAVIEVLPGPHQPAAARILGAYGFEPAWQVPWFHLPLAEVDDSAPPDPSIHKTDPSDLAQVARVLGAGYGYAGAEREAWQMVAQFGYQAPDFACFVAIQDQQAVAAGILHLDQTSALVDGAATLPGYRGRGLQKALLVERLRYAKRQGATHAFSRTGAGSISHANLEKVGMCLLVQSTAWRRAEIR
ncbi:MAG: GNAT family N-acetyltransferase [Caldilineaceae bacterium]|nr:GNAT family N-acetyltransferase [Caldilineaceae bacterium]MBP8110125.1 GNAT family N-acetyltransferase [Caldilineaceae bacterium]MBP8124995.1 GNAT family N-acetyltransferase [Caldilineaceae bacterium]